MLDFIVNEHIDADTVRLLDGEQMIGVVTFKEALSRARAVNLDLVQVADGSPPVCRILDGDRYRFERKKAERDHARKQRLLTVDTKEIQLRPVTDTNDIAIKAKRAKSFLDDGDKVKVIVRFRGRERSHKEIGFGILDQFLVEVGDHKVEKPIATSDGEMSILLGSMVSKAELQKQKNG